MPRSLATLFHAGRACCTAIAFFVSLVAARASSAPPPVHHVKSFTSASGRYQLEVDPTDRYGAGLGNCKLTEGARIIWSATMPFTLYDAAVLENGTVAGYGYTHGKGGVSYTYRGKDPNEVRAAILDPSGKQILHAKFPRQRGNYPGAGFGPAALGMMVHDDFFILRMPDPGEVESWHRYRLTTGETLDPIHPQKPAATAAFRCWIEEARGIAGTPLTAFRWEFYHDDRKERFTVFNLAKPDGASVWESPPHVHHILSDNPESDRLERALGNDGAISPDKEPGRFELWFPSENLRVRYAARQQQDDSWKVEKISERPFALTDEPQPAPVAAPEPKRLGIFTLDTPPPAGPVRSVDTFSFDTSGRIGFLRESTHFVLIEPNGTLIAELPLNLPADTTFSLAPLAADRWLITASDRVKARAWWIDVSKKSFTEIPGFDCPAIESLAAAADGGFVTFTSRFEKSTFTEALIAFDASGKQRWNKSLQGGNLFPKDLTVTTKGEVAVLDNNRKSVVIFDSAGAQLSTIDLTKAWRREPILPKSLQHEPNYPSSITADKDGGYIVTDFDGQPPFVRMTAAGKVHSRFSPRFKDGRLADQSGEIRAAPDGRLWLNNGHSLLRLDDKGRATDILGQKPDSSSLAVIAAAACDDSGHICAIDSQTGTVHVFDDAGRRQGLRRPDKKDFAGAIGGSSPAIASDGRILLDTGVSEEHCIMFGSDGKRVPLGLKTGTGDEWTFRQGAGGLLRCGFKEITLTDDKGAAQKVITRQPDRRWLEFTTGVAVAPDGSFVAVSGHGDSPRSLNFYSPQGDPQRTIAAPVQASLQLQSWTGTHLLISTEKESLLCDRDGKPVLRLHQGIRGGDRAQFLTRGGREWWTLDFATRRVTRYAVP